MTHKVLVAGCCQSNSMSGQIEERAGRMNQTSEQNDYAKRAPLENGEMRQTSDLNERTKRMNQTSEPNGTQWSSYFLVQSVVSISPPSNAALQWQSAELVAIKTLFLIHRDVLWSLRSDSHNGDPHAVLKRSSCDFHAILESDSHAIPKRSSYDPFSVDPFDSFDRPDFHSCDSHATPLWFSCDDLELHLHSKPSRPLHSLKDFEFGTNSKRLLRWEHLTENFSFPHNVTLSVLIQNFRALLMKLLHCSWRQSGQPDRF